MAEVADQKISGKKFKKMRLKLVLTQDEFAAKLGMSGSNVRRVEAREDTTIRPESLRNLAVLAGMDPADMLKELAPSTESPLAQILAEVASLSDQDQDELAARLVKQLPATAGKIVRQAAKKGSK